MARLLQIFGFLSVVFRGATLTFQSLVVGGVIFLIFVLRRANVEADALKPACLRWIRRAAFALAAMQIAYVMANSLILMQSAGISLAEVSGASFVLAGAPGIRMVTPICFFPQPPSSLPRSSPATRWLAWNIACRWLLSPPCIRGLPPRGSVACPICSSPYGGHRVLTSRAN